MLELRVLILVHENALKLTHCNLSIYVFCGKTPKPRFRYAAREVKGNGVKKKDGREEKGK